MGVKYDIPFQNMTGSTIPAYAVMAVRGSTSPTADGGERIEAFRPAPNEGSAFMLNGPIEVPAGGTNLGTVSWGALALVDSAGEFSIGDKVSPESGFVLKKKGEAFRIISGVKGTGQGGQLRRVAPASGGGGTGLTPFELAEDLKNEGGDASLAWPLKADGTADTSDEDARFYVLNDADQTFWGLKEYTGTTDETEHGYRGEAVFVTEDHDSTGIPGYEIVTMDGPVPLMQVSVPEDFTHSERAAYSVETPLGLGESWGAGRPPEAESAGSSTLLCRDPEELAKGAGSGATFLAAWEREEEVYRLIGVKGQGVTRIKGTITSSVSRQDGTFQLTEVELVCGVDPGVDTVTVTNEPPIFANAQSTIHAICDITVSEDPEAQWTTADAANSEEILKGYPSFDVEKMQVLFNAGGGIRWQDTAPCEENPAP